MGNFRKHSPRVFWSEAEVNILMEHYPSLSAAELLEKLPGRTIRVIDIEFHALCTDSVRWIGQRIDAAVRRLR